MRQKAAVRRIQEAGVAVEFNPTSNRILGIPSGRLQDHPLAAVMRYGAHVTINTDDAGIFGTNLNHEYMIMAGALGLGLDAVTRIIDDGFDNAFIHRVRGESLDHLR